MERKPFGNFENILMCFVSFFPWVKNSVAPLLYYFLFFKSTFFCWYFINNKMTKNRGNIIEFNCVFWKRFLSVINKTCTGYLKNTWWTLYSTKLRTSKPLFNILYVQDTEKNMLCQFELMYSFLIFFLWTGIKCLFLL